MTKKCAILRSHIALKKWTETGTAGRPPGMRSEEKSKQKIYWPYILSLFEAIVPTLLALFFYLFLASCVWSDRKNNSIVMSEFCLCMYIFENMLVNRTYVMFNVQFRFILKNVSALKEMFRFTIRIRHITKNESRIVFLRLVQFFYTIYF